MRRLLILILILLGLFSLFFYFSLGSQPQLVGKEVKAPTGTNLDSTIKNNPEYASYVYVEGAGYVLKDRKMILLIGKDTAQSRQAEAIKSVENDLEKYWKWQILLGNKNIEELSSEPRKGDYEGEKNRIGRKNIFSRILDVFKVADAVNVVRDNAKTCDCDDDLLLLSGQDLHLIQTTLNPDGGAAGMGVGTDEKSASIPEKKSTIPPTEPQNNYGKGDVFLIGIIDSGLNNEDSLSSKIDNTLNYNFLDHTSNVADSFMHGTEIARIIVKETKGNNINLVGLKTFDKNSVGNLYDGLCSIIYAIKHNMKVVNTSWGATQKKSTPIFDEVLKRAKAANMVVICSAGNIDIDIDKQPYYPACYADNSEFGTHVITVTSKHDTVVCQNYSTSGKKIDLTYDSDYDCKHLVPNEFGSGSTSKLGTSYATPYVTSNVVKYMIGHPSGFSKSGYIGSVTAGGPIRIY